MPSNKIYDQNGWYAVDNNPIARSGILEYLGSQISSELIPDKIYRVWRPDEELDNPETLKSFELLPWMGKHAMIGVGGAPAESVGVQGITGENVYFDKADKTLKSKIKAFGSSLMSAIENGVKQLSIGMKCDWIIESGYTPDGQKYDVKQVNIRGNHLASVPLGRAGSSVAVMDSSDMITFAMDELNFVKTNSNEGKQMTIEEMMQAVKEAQPAKEELQKLVAEITAMLGGEESDSEQEGDGMDKDEMDPEEKAPVGAMDAAAISSIVHKAVTKAVNPLKDRIKQLEGSAMDEQAIINRINEKNAIVSKVSQIVGDFDHSKMSLTDVAKYALKHEKIGIACDSGEELATLKGFLASQPKKIYVRDGDAQDSAPKAKSKFTEEAGL